ncbi:transmembrane and coiled-coil domain-containing protein 4 isoform X3 [Cricetulus griseus]|uniref:Transmembrane and coiled-coil domain-containing protein 4 isoform X3 n=1 Tax=Cricetulus griseus TaxID=10029 RepID=A0A9J7GNY0_CRIGR|nr:transmembrane and coiled-coil domain-containing protein 4 isoform X3 [Cricetulus griseus]
MATSNRPHSRQPLTAEPAAEAVSQPLGQELTEANRFAYAALCGISLSQLFPEPEQSPFCTELVTGLVKWLHLSEAVLPTMTAFASGLGGEEADIFAQTLLKDPILKGDPSAVTQDLLSFSLKDGHYDARARVLVCHVTSLLQVPMEELDILEEAFLESLRDTKEEESETAEASRKKKEKQRKWKRYLLIGLATVGGGAVIGYKMKKRVGAIEEFMFLPLTEGRQLHITIAITGWLGSGIYRTFSAPWTALARSQEQYCLAWEAKYLMELGNALETILSGLANMVAQEALKYTVLSGIVAALTWPASLLSVANVIDNPWGVCLHRSAEVGKHLAHILLSRQQGRRPVTLIGFSLGARVIYFCLQEMAQEEGPSVAWNTDRLCWALSPDCQGIIEDVVLLGAPVEGDPKYWEPFRKVVSGRIVNGYCRGDWLLSFVYRTSSVQLRVAGLQPVLLQDRRMENVDLSSVVNGHLDYAKQMDVILKTVGIRTKPGWGEKGFPLAPGSLPQEEPLQTAAVSTDETIHQDGQTQGPDPGDSLKTAIPSSARQAQMPTELNQSTETLLPTAASPAEGPLICSHGVSSNPLGCPDCTQGTQESCAELD